MQITEDPRSLVAMIKQRILQKGILIKMNDMSTLSLDPILIEVNCVSVCLFACVCICAFVCVCV